jgi:hypothetical protein
MAWPEQLKKILKVGSFSVSFHENTLSASRGTACRQKDGKTERQTWRVSFAKFFVTNTQKLMRFT